MYAISSSKGRGASLQFLCKIAIERPSHDDSWTTERENKKERNRDREKDKARVL